MRVLTKTDGRSGRGPNGDKAGVAHGRGNFNSGPASPRIRIRSARRWSVAVGRTRRPTTALHSSKPAPRPPLHALSPRPRSSFGKEGRKTAAAGKKKEGWKDDSGGGRRGRTPQPPPFDFRSTASGAAEERGIPPRRPRPRITGCHVMSPKRRTMSREATFFTPMPPAGESIY